MSATGRGRERERADEYVTEPGLAEVICATVAEKLVGPVNGYRMICEPSAGPGAWLPAICEQWPEADVTAIDSLDTEERRNDLHEAGARHVYSMDWCDVDKTFDLVIGNPPYSLARQHIKHAIRHVSLFGYVVFLLRLNFLGSIGRVGFWQRYPPLAVWPLVPRPCFLDGSFNRLRGKDGKLGSDATEYAVFVWPSLIRCQGMASPISRSGVTDVSPLVWQERKVLRWRWAP